MFPKFRKLDLDLKELAQRMQERKAELTSELGVETDEEREVLIPEAGGGHNARRDVPAEAAIDKRPQ